MTRSRSAARPSCRPCTTWSRTTRTCRSTCSATTAQLRHFVNVYVNDDDSRHLQGGETPVKDGDTLTIVPSIAGGLDAVGTGGAPSFHLQQNPDLMELVQ